MGEEGKLSAISGLAGNYSAALQPETAKMWLYLLRGYSAEQVQEAALAVIREHGPESVPYRAMPPFSLMQKALDRICGSACGAERESLMAEAEWGRVLRCVRETGSWRTPDLPPATRFVLRQMGGWQCACAWREQDLPWRRREFMDLWKLAAGRVDALEQGAEAVAALAPLRLAAQAQDRRKASPEQSNIVRKTD